MAGEIHAFEAPSTNRFRFLWDLGYRSIVPIIPPGADISEGSSLYKRIGTRQDARGKTPGVKGRDGKWFSWDWVPHVADEHDTERWHAMGAGVGLKTGDGLYAIDADTLDEPSARAIRDIVQDIAGATPVRVGRYPKALYLIRVSEDVPYTKIEFGPPDERGNFERVELLGARKQFVAFGTHNKTNKPYGWPKQIVPFDELPILDAADLSELFARFQQQLPDAQRPDSEGSGENVNQDTLKGDPATVRAAVEATPNTSAMFPSRESYRDFGYAIKAALPDDEHEAFEIFSEWCGRWAEGDNDPDIVASDWRRMRPPFRRGASWLYDLAERYSDGQFSTAAVHFDPIPVQTSEPSPFDVQAQHERQQEQANDVFDLLTPSQLMQRPKPTFLIERHIPDVSTGFLYSAPGIGKSFLAIDMGLAIANGLGDWHGDQINAAPDRRHILYIAAEGAFDLGNRIAAWHKSRAIPSISDNFLIIEQTIDFMHQEDVNKLLRTVHKAGVKPAMVFVDTVSRAMPGADENLQKEMTLFVKACDKVKETFSCAVMGIHHAGKSGDMRGSTVLKGAGDYVIRMDREKGKKIATVTMEKQKAAEDGWEEPFVLEKVELDDGQSSLSISRVTLPGRNDDGEREQRPMQTSAPVLELVLQAMAKAWEMGEPWGKTSRSKGRYAVRKMVTDFGLRAEEAEAYLDLWVKDGTVEIGVASSTSKLQGYRVLRQVNSQLEPAPNLENEAIFG